MEGASYWKRIDSTDYRTPLSSYENNLIEDILHDSAVPRVAIQELEGEDWSGLTQQAKLEKMADHRFDESWDI